MIAEVICRDRLSGVVRKISTIFSKKDMRKLEVLLKQVNPNEAIVEILINYQPLE